MPSAAPISSPAFLQEVFEAIPSMLLVVDEDLRIQCLNGVASAGLGLDARGARHHRLGDLLPCPQAGLTEAGCGRGPLCGACALRGSVVQALGGDQPQRRSTRLPVGPGSEAGEALLLVSATPFSWAGKLYVILIVEDPEALHRLLAAPPGPRPEGCPPAADAGPTHTC